MKENIMTKNNNISTSCISCPKSLKVESFCSEKCLMDYNHYILKSLKNNMDNMIKNFKDTLNENKDHEKNDPDFEYIKITIKHLEAIKEAATASFYYCFNYFINKED